MAHKLRDLSKEVAEAAAWLQHYYNEKAAELRKQRVYRSSEHPEGDKKVTYHKDKYDYYEVGEPFVRLPDEAMETPTHMEVEKVEIELETDVVEDAEEVSTNMHLGREDFSKLKYHVVFVKAPASEGIHALAQNAVEHTKRHISTAGQKPLIKKSKEEVRQMEKTSKESESE